MEDFKIEQVFYEFNPDTPILFVCKDSMKTRYLVSCCNLNKEWIGVQVSIMNLVDLINDYITIRELFCRSDAKVFHVKWNGETYEYYPVTENLFPSHNSKLNLWERSDVYKYKQQLRSEMRISQ